MINRSNRSKAIPLNINGSSTFGRYPKISVEKTVNMFSSDNFMVPYAGYEVAVPASYFGGATEGRAIHSSTKLGVMIGVFSNVVYSIKVNFDQQQQKVLDFQTTFIGTLVTRSGPVYISENNKPQILISDGSSLYVYDPVGMPPFKAISTSFKPGQIDFHDTYFLCAAISDYDGGNLITNTWRLSAQNDGTMWPDTASNVGALQTKPDNTQAVVRIPSRGNAIFVFGETVAESWYDLGNQLFPYSRSSSFNCDYGCLNPATVATLDEYVVWLAVNDKSGPSVMYSNGGTPEKITTDGFDYVLANMQAPEDSQAFIYRQDGHIFYHINFYTDNISFFIDFLKDGSKKIYHATDENGNYFIARSIAYFDNQYYFVSNNNANLYAFDTIFTTYDYTTDPSDPKKYTIPRIRRCKNIRNESQEYFIASDAGFTIESGETDYQQQELNEIYLTTQKGDYLVTNETVILFVTQNGDFIVTQNDEYLISQQEDLNFFEYLIEQQKDIVYTVPRVDMAVSIDGGAHFSSYDSQELPPIGYRKNKLMWWQLGAANDLVCEFTFWSLGRFVATDGVVNIRQ